MTTAMRTTPCVLRCVAFAVGLAPAMSGLVAAAVFETQRYTLDIPVGWTAESNAQTWIAHPASGATDCGVAPAAQISSSIPRDAARQQMWDMSVRGRHVLQSQPTQQDTDAAGRIWTVDAAAIEEAGAAYVLVLSVVELDGRAEGFVVVATSASIERCQQAIDTLLASVRPRKVVGAGSTAQGPSPMTATPNPLGSPTAGRLAGVWTATTHSLRYGAGGLENRAGVQELILFADGAALWGMPAEGLTGFDRTAHRAAWPSRWGSYTLRDERLTITRDAEELTYAVLANGALERRYVEGGQARTGERFVSRPALDGVPLNGEVRRKDHWPAPGNTSGIGTVKGCTFTPDGTFRDERLMWVVLERRDGESSEAYEARVAPGQGRYRLEHWTLVLQYDDGRASQVSWIATDEAEPTHGALLNGIPIEPNPY